MIKKTVNYNDLDGNPVSEVLNFHLNAAELIELQMSETGGFGNMIQQIVDSENNKEIIATFKKILLMSYGKRKPDGRGFTKSDELSKQFSQSEAYSALFVELSTDSDSAIAFINALIPEEAREMGRTKPQDHIEKQTVVKLPDPEEEPEKPTPRMTLEELDELRAKLLASE